MSSEQENKISKSFKEIVESISDKIGDTGRSYNVGQTVPVKLGGNKGIVKAIAKTKIQAGSSIAVVKGENGDNYALQGNGNQTVISQTVVNDRWEMPLDSKQSERNKISRILILWHEKTENKILVALGNGKIIYQTTYNDNWFQGKIKVFKDDSDQNKLKWCVTYISYDNNFNVSINYIEGLFFGDDVKILKYNLSNISHISSRSFSVIDGDLAVYKTYGFGQDTYSSSYFEFFDGYEIHRARVIYKKGIAYNCEVSYSKSEGSEVQLTENAFGRTVEASYSSSANLKEIGIEYLHTAKGYINILRLLSTNINSSVEAAYSAKDTIVQYGVKTEINSKTKVILAPTLGGGSNTPIDSIIGGGSSYSYSVIFNYLPSNVYKLNDKQIDLENFLFPDKINIDQENNQGYKDFLEVKNFYTKEKDTKEQNITFSSFTKSQITGFREQDKSEIANKLINKDCICCGIFEKNKYVTCKGKVVESNILEVEPYKYQLNITINIQKKDTNYFYILEKPTYIYSGFIFHCNFNHILRCVHRAYWHNQGLLVDLSKYDGSYSSAAVSQSYQAYFAGRNPTIYNYIWDPSAAFYYVSGYTKDNTSYIAFMGSGRSLIALNHLTKKASLAIIVFEVNEKLKGLTKPIRIDPQEIIKPINTSNALLAESIAYFIKNAS